MIGNRCKRLFVLGCLPWNLVFAQSAADNATPPPPLPAPSSANGGQAGNNPTPVAQALTPEGVYAMQLLEALKLSPAAEPGQAEEVLTNLGIEPKNGWISDYPVTPAVLGELDQDISDAGDQAKISLSKEQALKRVNELKARLGFQINSSHAIPPAAAQTPRPAAVSSIYSYRDNAGALHYTDNFDSIPPEFQAQAKVISQTTQSAAPPPPAGNGYSPQYTAVPDPNAIYNYYQTQGPPVVTYYAPPEPYYYLYSWAPYPFWSSGYYFPGYFVLNNFTRQVMFNSRPYSVSHHAGPVNAASGAYGGVGGNYGYSAPGALAGARAINNLEQNRANQAGLGWGNQQPAVGHNAIQGAPFGGQHVPGFIPNQMHNPMQNQAQYNPQQQIQQQQHFQQQQLMQQQQQLQQQHFQQQQLQQQHFQQQQQQHFEQQQRWANSQPVEHNFGGGGNNFQGGGFNGFHGGGGEFHGGGGFQGGGNAGGFHAGGGGHGGRR